VECGNRSAKVFQQHPILPHGQDPLDGPVQELRLVDIKLYEINVQCFGVDQYQLAGLAKSRECDQTDLLSSWTIDDGGIKSRLIADEKDVWAFLDHKLITVLERIAP